jgi:hypothetical protein
MAFVSQVSYSMDQPPLCFVSFLVRHFEHVEMQRLFSNVRPAKSALLWPCGVSRYHSLTAVQGSNV